MKLATCDAMHQTPYTLHSQIHTLKTQYRQGWVSSSGVIQ